MMIWTVDNNWWYLVIINDNEIDNFGQLGFSFSSAPGALRDFLDFVTGQKEEVPWFFRVDEAVDVGRRSIFIHFHTFFFQWLPWIPNEYLLFAYVISVILIGFEEWFSDFHGF